MTAESSSFARVHGGPDHAGVPLHDFSTNSNACGPSPHAMLALQQADPTRYPDAAYTELRAQLAGFHGVDKRRIVLAASASEFIFRITAVVSLRGGKAVSLPAHAYGDYAGAAYAHSLELAGADVEASLRWSCEPSSPMGVADGRLPELVASTPGGEVLVLDRAYEPLRLEAVPPPPDALLQKTWQLWTPNKALGMTGVRAAYAVAPLDDSETVDAVQQLAPSWPVGSHGVAMLQAWATPDVQHWLAACRQTLLEWKTRQITLFTLLGWKCEPSLANFFCARPMLPDGMQLSDALALLRERNIKLRDTASFGLPGMVRVSVQPPAVQDALHYAWQSMMGPTT